MLTVVIVLAALGGALVVIVGIETALLLRMAREVAQLEQKLKLLGGAR